MKLTKKIRIGLTATVLAITPLSTVLAQVQPVLAAKKSVKKAKGTVQLLENDYVYNQFGNKIKIKQDPTSKAYLIPTDFRVDKKGFAMTDVNSVKDTGENYGTYPYYGTKKINGRTYYQLANNYYLDAAVVINQNGKNTKKNKLILNHNSFVYNKNGRTTGKKLFKKDIVSYQGKIKSATEAPTYFFYEDDSARHLKIEYLPTAKIKGKNFYSLGQGHYIKAANVGYIDGHAQRYNGVATATVLTESSTTTVNYSSIKRTLKKGQKIKVDLAVIPYANDGFEGYIFRLHDHPDEYIDQNNVSLKVNLPIVNYEDLTYTFVQPLSGDTVQLYDTTGKSIGKSIKKQKYRDLTVDGLMYLWVPEEKKAELFYHCLNYENSSVIDANNSATTNSSPAHPVEKQKLNYGNNFIKASDVKYISGIKLNPINTAAQAESDQKTASETDKQELAKLIDQEKDRKINSAYTNLKANYDSALTNAILIQKSDKVTVAEVKEAVWYLKTAITQLTTMSYPLGD